MHIQPKFKIWEAVEPKDSDAPDWAKAVYWEEVPPHLRTGAKASGELIVMTLHYLIVLRANRGPSDFEGPIDPAALKSLLARKKSEDWQTVDLRDAYAISRGARFERKMADYPSKYPVNWRTLVPPRLLHTEASAAPALIVDPLKLSKIHLALGSPPGLALFPGLTSDWPIMIEPDMGEDRQGRGLHSLDPEAPQLPFAILMPRTADWLTQWELERRRARGIVPHENDDTNWREAYDLEEVPQKASS